MTNVRSLEVVDSISTDVQNTSEAVVLPTNSEQVAVTDSEMHTLYKLLSRPTLLKYFVWENAQVALPIYYPKSTYDASSDPANFSGVVDILEFPQAILDANPVALDKVSLFSYIKADIEIELKVNASPFAAGALGLHYLPYLNEVQQLAKTSNLTLPGLTSCPYVKLVLGQTNSVKLVAPWINEFDMFDLTTPGDYFGSMLISCLSPISDGSGAPTATVSVFARFINPEVRVPTNVIPSQRVKILKKLITALQGVDADQFVAHGSEGEHAGPITTIADKVATVSGALSDVPVIGALARPISWVARLGSKVASVFGFSKPLNQSSMQFVDRVPARGYTNLEGFDNSVVLGSIPDNAVDPQKASNEDIDQMSVDFIKTQNNIFEAFKWESKGTAFNQNRLATWAVHPTPYQLLQGLNCQFGSFGYMSSMAHYWRGGINFTLTFIATRFHAGRLLVVYFPNGDVIDTPSTVGSLMSTNYHMVVDLNELNSDVGSAGNFTFNIPYVQNRPWLRTCYPSIDAISIVPRDFNGVIAVYALTDLIQPDTCASSIQVLVSMSGAEDFALSMPRTNIPIGWMVRETAPAPVKIVEVKEEDEEYVAEGKYDDINGPVHQMIPNVTHDDATIPCMGEYFTSLRSFAKRAVMIRPIDDISLLNPGFFLRTSVGRFDETGVPLSVSPLEQVSNLFRFSSGSVRYKVKSTAQETIRSSWVDNAYEPLGIEHETNSMVNNIHEVNVPYYHATRLKSHNSNSPRIDEKRILIKKVPLQYLGGQSGVATAEAFSSVQVNITTPTVVSFDRYGFSGLSSAYNQDIYIGVKYTGPGGDRSLPVYEHGQWVMPTFAINNGNFFITNISDSQVKVSYKTTDDFSPVAELLESAGDDWSAFFMVPPSVIHTRDYQVA